MERELAAAGQVSLDQLGLSFCPHGEPQIRQGQVLGGPLVEPGLAQETEGSGPPLQVHRDRHPAAIQPGRQQPGWRGGQGLHAQATTPGSIAKPFTHPGFIEAKGPGHRLVQTQLEIWGEGRKGTPDPALGRQHPPQGGTHDGRQTGQGVALERCLEIELAGDQAPTRQQGQGQGALGLQLRTLQPLQFQDLILPTQAGLPGPNDGIAALGGLHGQDGFGRRPRQPQRARQGIAGQPRGQGLIPPPIPWIELPAALPIQLGTKPTRHAQPGGTQSQLDLVHL